MAGRLPTFLGIGAPKAGSTWLYELLRAHPDIGMTERRKEIHYFDRNYERGVDWYRKFFEEVSDCEVIGEFTPLYLYSPELSDRIAESAPTVTKLLASLRDPVERAHSAYGFRVRVEGYEGSFEQYLEERPAAITRGFYGQHLERLQPWLSSGSLLPLVFEEAIRDVEQTKVTLADFLEVEAHRFPADAGHKKVNRSYAPRFKKLYVRSIALASRLRRADQDGLINFAKAMGIKRMFEREGTVPIPAMDPATRLRLIALFEPDVSGLEELLGRPLSIWREAWAKARSISTSSTP